MRNIVLAVTGIFLCGCAVSKSSSDDMRLLAQEGVYADTSCSNDPFYRNRDFKDHIIRADADGMVVSIDGGVLDSSQAIASMTHILDQAELLASKKNSDDVRIVVFVHGGLNSIKNTNEKIDSGRASAIMCDGDDWSYPVFISWPTGVFSSWWAHLTSVREGKKARKLLTLPTVPFVIASDLLYTVSSYPVTASYQLSNEKDRLASAGKLPGGVLSQSWEDSVLNFCPSMRSYNTAACDMAAPMSASSPLPLQLSANLSVYYPDRLSWLWGLRDVVTSPVRYSAGILYHGGVARASWDVMKRRADNLFYPPPRFDSRFEEEGEPAGAFFDLLLTKEKSAAEAKGSQKEVAKKYALTLVGHSMGAIVLNNAFVRYREKWLESNGLKNIVYMAGAASIEDSLAALTPILESGRNSDRKAPNFFNLTLNRVAEVSEANWYGLIPTGSLLISIDQHYEKPEHPLARTIGAEVNVLSAIEVIDDVLKNADGQVVFKAFNRGPGTVPAKHGDFSALPFWRESTWRLNQGGAAAGAPIAKGWDLEVPQ